MLYVIYCYDFEFDRRKEFILQEESVEVNEKLLGLLELLMKELEYTRILKATVNTMTKSRFNILELDEFCKKLYFMNITNINTILKNNYQREHTKEVTDGINSRNEMNKIIRKMKTILKFSLAKNEGGDAMYIRSPGSYGSGRRG